MAINFKNTLPIPRTSTVVLAKSLDSLFDVTQSPVGLTLRTLLRGLDRNPQFDR